MTPWIVLTAVAALSARFLRHGRPQAPALPRGYDGERQLAELRALVAHDTSPDPPPGPGTPGHVRARPAERKALV